MNLPRVTDHAVLRYLERIKGLDVEAVRIAIARTCAIAAGSGAGSIKTAEARFVLARDGAVISVLPASSKSIGQRRGQR